jgi:hypothetical protein
MEAEGELYWLLKQDSNYSASILPKIRPEAGQMILMNVWIAFFCSILSLMQAVNISISRRSKVEMKSRAASMFRILPG